LQAWANKERAESKTNEGYKGLTAEEEAARKESFPVVPNKTINPATGESFEEGTEKGRVRAEEAEKEAARKESLKNVVDPETGKTQRNISMNEKRGVVAKRTRELQAEDEARQEESRRLRAERGYGKEEVEQERKEAQEKRLAEIESGERLAGEVTPNEDLTTMEGVGRGVKNVGRGFKRRFKELRAERAEREAEKRPRKTSAERKAEYREKRMDKKAREKEERQTDQDRRVAHAKQDARIDYALEVNAIDRKTKSILDSTFGRGKRAATRNKVAAGVEHGRFKGREAGLSSSHPKYRQEGSRDLVNRFIEQFGVGSLNTQQGQQWLDSIKDGVMYAPEDSELYGLRIPGQESFDASKKIWEKLLQPRELEQIGIETPAVPADKVSAEENAFENKPTKTAAVLESEAKEKREAEAVAEAGLANLTPSQKRAKAREEFKVDTNVQFNTNINQKAKKRKGVQAKRNAKQKEKFGISGRKDQPESAVVNTPSNVVGNNVSENTEDTAPTTANEEEQPEAQPETRSYSGSPTGRQAAVNQNAVLRNLSQTDAFTTATKNAISSFINDADDKDAARAELQQHIDDFQDNPEKWNEWTAEQTKGQINFVRRTPKRATQNVAINKLTGDSQSAIKSIITDAKKQGNENKARNLIQTLLESFGDDVEKWAEWYKAYEAEGKQIGSYENVSSLGSRVFAASADNKVTKFTKNLLGKFDEVFKALSPTPKVKEEIPASFFYKSVKDTDLIVNDKVSHIVKGLDEFLINVDGDKPPLRLNIFEKQERNVRGRFTGASLPKRTDYEEYQGEARQELGGARGHAGGKGWSGAHLVPMYRTVHRRIPRELILRAIRWVNPANFFKSTTGKPITELSDDDWRAMDRDELIKNITTLNEYREESLVIANRYDQMIALIDGGNTPYAVLWDTKDKWATLENRMDRAQDLKQGTANWEKQLDKTALRLRKILGEEKFNTEDGEKSHFGMIDELFDEDKGRIPFFKDITKKDKPWLRTTRGTGLRGQPEEAARVIATNAVAGIRAARYQIPSMRETLNPTIAEIRSDEFREIMLQAPIYQGIRMPTEEELRSRDRLEITAEMIRQAAPNYSRPEESPFLRTVNNPAGIWQEDAGVDAAMIRSTRFVAETLRLTRTPEEIQADDAYIERIQASEQRTATGLSAITLLASSDSPN